MNIYSFSTAAQAALEGLRQPYAVYQPLEGNLVTLLVSEGFRELFDWPDREAVPAHLRGDLRSLTHPDDRDRLAAAVERFAAGASSKLDVVFRTRTDAAPDYHVIHAHGASVPADSGIRLLHVWFMDEGLYTEDSENSNSPVYRLLSSTLREDSIVKAAHYDELTGLPNLTYFFKLCEVDKAWLLSTGRQGVLLYIDLDGMKYFNHRYGFAEGDRLLKALAAELVQLFGAERCCHVGADRFAARAVEDGLDELLTRLFRAARQLNNGNTLPVHVGIYSTGTEDVPVSTAYDRAKMACDAIRKSSASASNRYNWKLQDTVRRHQYLVKNIDKAIEERWIQVYFQPIVRAVSGKICNEEALARWIDPTEGFLSPSEFIPQLENAGLVYKLDLYVLEQVLDKLKGQKQAGLNTVPHSINLSRSDFDTCDIVEEIRRRVDDAGVERDKIVIEITESVIGTDFDFMKDQIHRFRSLGFPVWMDDFGSGYSSLDVLQSIPFDLIKFDISFMRKLDEGSNGKIILTEMMRMATALGVSTVCEGVETERQVHFLQEIGCSRLQGFYFSRPLPLKQLESNSRQGSRIGFEDPDVSAYFETIGRANLYDLSAVAGQEDDTFLNTFNTLPMGIVEVRGETARFVRSNPSYRDFLRRFLGIDPSLQGQGFFKFSSAFMQNLNKTCCLHGLRSFSNEKMPDGSVVHSLSRRISVNPLTGDSAVAIAVLSISEPDEAESYADIARALAADYYNIYIVDLDTESFIEYSSPVGQTKLAMERHGIHFFAAVRRDTMTRIYEDDRPFFLNWFTRENVLAELDTHGVFITTYRLIDTGKPMLVSLKVTRLQGTNRIILGVSKVEDQASRQSGK